MLLGLVFIACLLTVPLARGRLTALADLQLRRVWLALAGIGVQILIISVLPDGMAGLHEGIHMFSYALLGAFAWSNRRIPGVPLIMLGGAAELHRDRRQRRRDARRSGARRACRARGGEGFVNSGAMAEPEPAVPRRRVRDPRVVAAVQRLQRRRHHDRARRARAAARRLPARASFPAAGARRRRQGPDLLRAALADSASRRFFAAHAQSCLGSGLAHVAMPLLAYEHTHSAWAVTAVLIPDLLPAILFGPLLGALVDRVGWRTCAIAADLLRMVAFTLVAFAHTLPWMVVGAALAGFGSALFSPAALSGVTRLARGQAPSGRARPVRRARRSRAHRRAGGRRRLARAGGGPRRCSAPTR